LALKKSEFIDFGGFKIHFFLINLNLKLRIREKQLIVKIKCQQGPSVSAERVSRII